ncbi:MAG: ParA family protein [Rickettsiaceae bacterium]|nr:ParA family protein [Rickettsiaceae bacterium]
MFDARITAVDAAQLKKVTTQAIHKELRAKKLKSFKSNNRVYFGHETSRSIFNHKLEKSIISFQIVKGGTGKTSIAHSFAIRSSLYGAKVLCIDLDQQGNLSQAFGVNCNNSPVMIDIINDSSLINSAIINIAPGIDILPSRIENAVLDNHLMLNKHPLDRVYKSIINQLMSDYDLVIIDCPPALGQSVTAATLASDIIIFPLTPEQFSLSGLEVSYREIKTINERFNSSSNLKILLNKFDIRTALSSEVLAKIMNHNIFKQLMCNTFIRSCQDFPNMLYAETNIFSNTKSSAAKDDIDLFTKEILQLENKK